MSYPRTTSLKFYELGFIFIFLKQIDPPLLFSVFQFSYILPYSFPDWLNCRRSERWIKVRMEFKKLIRCFSATGPRTYRNLLQILGFFPYWNSSIIKMRLAYCCRLTNTNASSICRWPEFLISVSCVGMIKNDGERNQIALYCCGIKSMALSTEHQDLKMIFFNLLMEYFPYLFFILPPSSSPILLFACLLYRLPSSHYSIVFSLSSYHFYS